jgi:hypothetical protein
MSPFLAREGYSMDSNEIPAFQARVMFALCESE